MAAPSFLATPARSASTRRCIRNCPTTSIRDFTGVGLTSTNAVLAVLHPSVPTYTLREFIAYATANPGKFAAGVAGSGSLLHFATELLKTTGVMNAIEAPERKPLLMSIICRRSSLGDRPSSGGNPPRPRKSDPSQAGDAVVPPCDALRKPEY